MTTAYSILAVDDEQMNLDLIELTFADIPEITVAMCANGQEALDYLADNAAIHVILLDLAMPVLDGFATLELLKNDPLLQRIPVIVVTANTEEKNRALAMGADDFIFKPYDTEELKLRTFNQAKIKDYQDQLNELNAGLEEKVHEKTKELQIALDLAVSAEREIAFRLGRAAEFRDLETGSHIKRMSYYSMKLAEKAGFREEEVQLILHAAPLHDIGKVGVPDQILLKPGRLTIAELEIMRQHAAIGAMILDDCEEYPVISAGKTIALQHHEKFDGSGYPQGLKGENIHIYGRICAISDVFDALTSKRVYKPAFPLEKALSIMAKERGSHFDPELHDLFIASMDEILEIRDQFPDSSDEMPNILTLIEAKR